MQCKLAIEEKLNRTRVQPQGKCEVCGAKPAAVQVVYMGQRLLRCEDCLKRIKRLLGVENPSNNEAGLHTCPYCNATGKTMFFVTQADLNLHVLRLHGGYPNSKTQMQGAERREAERGRKRRDFELRLRPFHACPGFSAKHLDGEPQLPVLQTQLSRPYTPKGESEG